MGLGPRYLDSPRALVVLRPMRLPVPKAHPAEVVLAVVALHVVAAAVLLDADAALRTLKKNTKVSFPWLLMKRVVLNTIIVIKWSKVKRSN
jgi:hypothetical protein